MKGLHLQERLPIIHWCEDCGTYLNIPVESEEMGRRLAECPYCGELLCETARDTPAHYTPVSASH
jgi:hypothetical protein